MQLYQLDNMLRGWFIGNFNPTVFKTSNVEVAIKYYNRGDSEIRHHHKIATEVTAIVQGKIKMNGVIYGKGDIIIIEPLESTDFECIEDESQTVVVKIPGAVNDKYIGESDVAYEKKNYKLQRT